MTLLAFVTARVLPGNRVYPMAGIHADERSFRELEARHRLDRLSPAVVAEERARKNLAFFLDEAFWWVYRPPFFFLSKR